MSEPRRLSALNAPNSVSAGAPPKTPLGEFTALPSPLAGFEGPLREGRGEKRGGDERGGKRGEGRGGKRGGEEKGGEGRPFW